MASVKDHVFAGEGRRCTWCHALDYEHERGFTDEDLRTFDLAAELINDFIGGNGIHWAMRIRELVERLRDMGYDMSDALAEMDADE